MSILLLDDNFGPLFELFDGYCLSTVHEQEPLNLTEDSKVHLAIKQCYSAARQTVKLLYLLLGQFLGLILHILDVDILNVINVLIDQFLEYGFEHIEIIEFLVRIELEFILAISLCFLSVVLDHTLDSVLPICLGKDVLSWNLM